MKKLLVVLIITFWQLSAMMPEDAKKTAKVYKKNSENNTESNNKRLKSIPQQESKRTICYRYASNGTEAIGYTRRIICPGINHTAFIPCNQTFAIILPSQTCAALAHQPGLVKRIAQGFFTERPVTYNTFVFATSSTAGLSKISINDFDNAEAFNINIINYPQ